MKGQKNRQEMTALMCAAKYGRTDIVTFLLEAESRILTNTTALLLAVQGQNYAVMKCLAPLEFDVLPSDGRTALMVAASDCDTIFVSFLLNYLGNENDVLWKTALEYAILGSKLQNLKTLIESGKFTFKQIQTAYYYSLTVTNNMEIRSYLKEEARNRGASVSNTDSAAPSLSASINDDCLDNINNDLERIVSANKEQEQMIEELQAQVSFYEDQVDKLKSTIAGEYEYSQSREHMLDKAKQELGRLSVPLSPKFNLSSDPSSLMEAIKLLVDRNNEQIAFIKSVKSKYSDLRGLIEEIRVESRHSDAVTVSGIDDSVTLLKRLKEVLQAHSLTSSTRSLSASSTSTDQKYKQRISSLEDALELARKTIDDLRSKGGDGNQRAMVDKEVYVWLPIQRQQAVRPTIEPIITSLVQSVRSISSRASRSRNTSICSKAQSQKSTSSVASSAVSTEKIITQEKAATGPHIIRASAPMGRDSISESKPDGATLSPYLAAAARLNAHSPVSPQDIALRASVEHVPSMMAHESSVSSAQIISTSPRQSLGVAALRHLSIDDTGITTLMAVAKSGDVAGVRASLSQAKKRNNEGLTALMMLAQHQPFSAGHLDAIRLLIPLEGGMIIESGKQMGSTALILALEAKNGPAAELLVGVEAGYQRDNGITALLLATFHGLDNISLRLIEAEGRIFKAGSQTPLMNAANHGSVIIAEKLLNQTRSTKQGGWTALMIAAQRGHADVVRILAPYEAGMRKDDGTTALLLAANGGFLEAARILAPKEAGLLHSKGHSALLLAARFNHSEIVKLLLEKEAGIPAKNTVTALMYASQKGHVETVKLLLDYEAGKMSEDQWTALMYAALNNQSEVVRILAPKEAKMQRSRYTGATAMIIAAEHGAVESVSILADYETGCTDKVGCTALMVAAQRGQTEVVKMLCDKESGKQTPEGITALMLAIQYSHKECIRLLYNKECHLKTAEGNTCSHYCVNADDFQLLQSLGKSHA